MSKEPAIEIERTGTQIVERFSSGVKINRINATSTAAFTATAKIARTAVGTPS